MPQHTQLHLNKYKHLPPEPLVSLQNHNQQPLFSSRESPKERSARSKGNHLVILQLHGPREALLRVQCLEDGGRLELKSLSPRISPEQHTIHKVCQPKANLAKEDTPDHVDFLFSLARKYRNCPLTTLPPSKKKDQILCERRRYAWESVDSSSASSPAAAISISTLKSKRRCLEQQPLRARAKRKISSSSCNYPKECSDQRKTLESGQGETFQGV